MWNPRIDILFLKDSNVLCGEHPLSALRPCFDLFFEQFPEQVKEVQKIAVWSSYWPQSMKLSPDVLIPLMRLETLKEFIVMIDKPWERECLDESRLWWIQKDIAGVLENVEKRAARYPDFTSPPGGWKVPVVRVVRSEEGIVGGEKEDMELRCENCVSLGKSRKELASWN
jgi:hypothetical protein